MRKYRGNETPDACRENPWKHKRKPRVHVHVLACKAACQRRPYSLIRLQLSSPISWRFKSSKSSPTSLQCTSITQSSPTSSNSSCLDLLNLSTKTLLLTPHELAVVFGPAFHPSSTAGRGERREGAGLCKDDEEQIQQVRQGERAEEKDQEKTEEEDQKKEKKG